MFGRDLVKFIFYNNLLDKELDLGSSNSFEFADYLSDDSIVYYSLYPDGSGVVSHKIYDKGIIRVEYLDRFNINNIPVYSDGCFDDFVNVESYVVQTYGLYSKTFCDWLKTLDSRDSLIGLMAQYFDEHVELNENSSTFDELITYLETNSADTKLITSAKLAWTQYMRECRII